MSYKELKREAYEANMRLPQQGLVVYTFGNVSAFDRSKGVFAIKPSGVDYEKLTPESIVVVDLDLKVVEGKLRPSSDTPTHAVLYRRLAGVGGVAHTHSTYAVAWAQAMRAIPILGTTHADHAPVDIPCTPPLTAKEVRGDYEVATGDKIVDYFKAKGIKHEETPMVLISNHGPFSWGKNAEKAVYHSKMLEEQAKMAYLTLQLNPKTPRLGAAILNKHYQRKHGKGAYYGQS